MKRTGRRIAIPIAAGAAMILAFLAVFAAAQTPPPGRPGPRAARAQAIADLGLTPDQVKALGEFRQARMNERRAFREEMGRIRGEMRASGRGSQGQPDQDRQAHRSKGQAQGGPRKGRPEGQGRAGQDLHAGATGKDQGLQVGPSGADGLCRSRTHGPARGSRLPPLPGPAPRLGTAAGTAGRAPKNARFKIGDMYPGYVSPFSFPAPPGDDPPVRVLNRGRNRPLSPGEPAWHVSCF